MLLLFVFATEPNPVAPEIAVSVFTPLMLDTVYAALFSEASF